MTKLIKLLNEALPNIEDPRHDPYADEPYAPWSAEKPKDEYEREESEFAKNKYIMGKYKEKWAEQLDGVKEYIKSEIEREGDCETCATIIDIALKAVELVMDGKVDIAKNYLSRDKLNQWELDEFDE